MSREKEEILTRIFYFLHKAVILEGLRIQSDGFHYAPKKLALHSTHPTKYD